MTIPAMKSRRVISGSGWSNPLTHDFPLESLSYLSVWADGFELALGVDYTVSGVGDPAGYAVTISNPGDWSPVAWVLTVEYPIDQPSDVDQGGQFGKRFEEALDRLALGLQTLDDRTARALKVSNTTDPDLSIEVDAAEPDSVLGWNSSGTRIENKGSVPQLQNVSDHMSEIVNVSDHMSSVITVEADLANVDIVAGSITNVNSVGGSITNVNAVAGDLVNVDIVAADVDKVRTVGEDIASVVTVAGSIANVNTVAGDLANVDTVAGSIGDVQSTGQNIASVATVAGSVANVNTVAGDLANVDTVAGSIGDVQSTGQDIASVVTVAGSIAAVNTAADNIEAIIDAPDAASAAAGSALAASGSASAASGSASAASGSATSANNSAIAAAASEAALAALKNGIAGGTTGQFLVKNSNANYDYSWATPTGMLTATYDPQGIAADVFDRTKHTGLMPLAALDQTGIGTSFLVGRSATSGYVGTVPLAVAATASSVPLRDVSGRVNVANSSASSHAVNKGQMDSAVSALDTAKLNKAGGTMTGPLVLIASTTTSAGFNIGGSGAGPSSPVAGDIWMVGDALYVRGPTTTRVLGSTGNLSTVSQAEAETGTATTARAWTAERVKQAIIANANATPSNKVFFLTSGTYTPPANLDHIVVTVVGAGGGGGGHSSGVGSGAKSGLGGGTAIKQILAASLSATETVTVGAGGAGGSTGTGTGGRGTDGGTSSFGSHCSATGGGGGRSKESNRDTLAGNGSGGDINLTGNPETSLDNSSTVVSAGGTSSIGGGAGYFNTASNSNIDAADNSGAGGSAYTLSGGSAYAGGAGGSGLVIIEEYF